MKVFISQPMKGKSDNEIMRERAEIIWQFCKEHDAGASFVDSFFQGAPADAKPLWYLGAALQVMAEADAAVFAKNWQEARGCRIEHAAAEAYGLKIVEI